jgi:hypothetical protein
MSRHGRCGDSAPANSMPAHAPSLRPTSRGESSRDGAVRLAFALLTLFVILGTSAACRTQDDSLDVAGDLYVLSATDHYDEAFDSATDWKADAYLISISGGVGSSESSGGGPSISLYFEAPSAAGSMYEVCLTKDTFTPEVVDLGSDTTLAPPIERDQWTLDSVDAWSIAQANGGEEYLLHYQGPMTMMVLTLASPLRHSRWPESGSAHRSQDWGHHRG